MKPKILATSWHPGGANAIAPVIRKLESQDLVDVVTIGHHFSEKIFADAGISYKRIAEYGLADVSVGSMDRLLAAESPQLVLTGTSAQDEKTRDVIEQTITVASRGRGIRSLAVLDFWSNYSLRFKDIYTGEDFRFMPDKVTAIDNICQAGMLAESFDREKIIITGNPHFDSLEKLARTYSASEKRKMRKQISLSQELLLFYAANAWKKDAPTIGYWDLDNIKLVLETIDELPMLKKDKPGFVIKLHPSTPVEEVEEITSYLRHNDGRGRVSLMENVNSKALVLATDITLTPSSTVGIEAVYMQRPCISLQPGLTGADALAILTKNNIIPVGYTPEYCKTLVRHAILDKSYRESELIEHASSFRTDGKATERVTKLVYKMLGIA